MTTKRKRIHSTQRKARRDAERFRWHLDSPWCERFDHEHWWPDDPDKEPREAALWEVLRRHPKAGKLHAGEAQPANAFENCIRLHGLDTWPNLHAGIRGAWPEILRDLPPQRGFDPRPVYSVTAQSVSQMFSVRGPCAPPQAMLTLGEKLRKRAAKDAEARRILEGAERVREEEIARLAIEHHRAGRILIAIHPDTTDFEDAVAALRACYKQHRIPTRHGKANVGDWLRLIRDFERAELQAKKAVGRDDNLSTKYRRMISRSVWP